MDPDGNSDRPDPGGLEHRTGPVAVSPSRRPRPDMAPDRPVRHSRALDDRAGLFAGSGGLAPPAVEQRRADSRRAPARQHIRRARRNGRGSSAPSDLFGHLLDRASVVPGAPRCPCGIPQHGPCRTCLCGLRAGGAVRRQRHDPLVPQGPLCRRSHQHFRIPECLCDLCRPRLAVRYRPGAEPHPGNRRSRPRTARGNARHHFVAGQTRQRVRHRPCASDYRAAVVPLPGRAGQHDGCAGRALPVRRCRAGPAHALSRRRRRGLRPGVYRAGDGQPKSREKGERRTGAAKRAAGPENHGGTGPGVVVKAGFQAE